MPVNYLRGISSQKASIAWDALVPLIFGTSLSKNKDTLNITRDISPGLNLLASEGHRGNAAASPWRHLLHRDLPFIFVLFCLSALVLARGPHPGLVTPTEDSFFADEVQRRQQQKRISTILWHGALSESTLFVLACIGAGKAGAIAGTPVVVAILWRSLVMAFCTESRRYELLSRSVRSYPILQLVKTAGCLIVTGDGMWMDRNFVNQNPDMHVRVVCVHAVCAVDRRV